jgi:hypothetical protein
VAQGLSVDTGFQNPRRPSRTRPDFATSVKIPGAEIVVTASRGAPPTYVGDYAAICSARNLADTTTEPTRAQP